MGVALITPFDDKGEVDFYALNRLVNYHLQNSTDYLVILGTTAETPTLSVGEQKEIKKTVVAQVGGRIPVVMGMGGNNTLALADRIQSEDFTGISAILSVVPYYNKPTQEGIYQHYKYIAKTSPLPVILYNVPSRTGVNMTADTTLRLAGDIENIVAVKEASGNMDQIADIIRHKPKNFHVISGDDAIAFPLIKEGGSGVISVLGNAYPASFRRMVHLALAGDYEAASQIDRHFTEMIKLLFVNGNPAGIKCILHTMGLIKNELRLPLIPVEASTCERIQREIRELNN